LASAAARPVSTGEGVALGDGEPIVGSAAGSPAPQPDATSMTAAATTAAAGRGSRVGVGMAQR
jgi:hypothetical protein